MRLKSLSRQFFIFVGYARKRSGLQIPPTRSHYQRNRDYKSFLQDGIVKEIGITNPPYKIASPVDLSKKYMRSGTNET